MAADPWTSSHDSPRPTMTPKASRAVTLRETVQITRVRGAQEEATTPGEHDGDAQPAQPFPSAARGRGADRGCLPPGSVGADRLQVSG